MNPRSLAAASAAGRSNRLRVAWPATSAQSGPSVRRFEATNPARALELRRRPARMPAADFAHAFCDRAPPAGEHAYRVRVRRTDGAFAWSSPIFIAVA